MTEPYSHKFFANNTKIFNKSIFAENSNKRIVREDIEVKSEIIISNKFTLIKTI